jgi:DNA ligase (NAD+)
MNLRFSNDGFFRQFWHEADAMQKKYQIRLLAARLRLYNHYYFNLNQSLVSDARYDEVKDELAKLDPTHLQLFKIGAETIDGVELPIPMPSLSKLRPGAAVEWIDKNKGMHYIGPKYDGQAGLIHYRDGIPIAAYTRGDGSEGSNVFAKAVFINGVGLPNIPRFGLQGDVYVGGEFIISQTTFAALKKIPRDDKGREYKTARNLMGGILRRKTVDRKLLGKIDFIAFKIESDTTAWVPGSKTVKPISEFNKEDKVRFLKQLGFITDLSLGQEHALSPLISHGAKKSYVSELLKRWRDACPYDTDGLVVEINDYKKAVKHGAGTLEATHAKAIKPDLKDHQIAETTINKLVFRCTHRGIYPAKIKIEPVEIGGVTIKSITGKNLAYLKRHGLGVGAKIQVIRSGEVIPEVLRVLTPAKVKYPKRCFHCQTELNDKSTFLYCPNKECPCRGKGSGVTFFKLLGVDEVGESTLVQLAEAGYDSVPKLLDASWKDFAKLDGFQKTKAKKVSEALHFALSESSLATIMYASNAFNNEITGLAHSRFDLIIDAFGPERVIGGNITFKELTSIKGIGPEVATIYNAGWPKFNVVRKELAKYVDFSKFKKKKKVKGKLTGKNFVFTGVRDGNMEAILEASGGKIGGGINKDTIVFAGDRPGQTKMNRAQDVGATIVPYAKAKTYIAKLLGYKK